MKPKRNSSPRSKTKSSPSATAVKLLIAKLYDGSAELHISILQNWANQSQVDSSEQEVIISITLPSAGTHFGKQRMDFDADQFAEVCHAYADMEITVDTAGERLGCSTRTFRRRYAEKYISCLMP